MQNVFSLSFIEQTKGWSDFFSMLPSFGIKDVKQKIVEYCLNLNSLESRLKLDEITTKKEESKRIWTDSVNRLSLKLDQLNLYIPTLNKKMVLTEKKVTLLKSFILLDGQETSVPKYLEKLKGQIKSVEESIDTSTAVFDENTKTLQQKEKLVASIKSYEKEHRKVFDLMETERQKRKDYSKMLSEIDEDLKDFQDIKWISSERTWDKVANSKLTWSTKFTQLS